MKEATGAGPGQRPSNPPSHPNNHTNTRNKDRITSAICCQYSVSQLCNWRVSAKVGGVRNVCIKEWVMTSPGSVQKRAVYFRKP